MIINKGGKFYNIQQRETETTKQLIKRSWFIVNNLHSDTNDIKTVEEFDNSATKSRLWYNTRFLGCKYSHDVIKNIEDAEKKIFV